MSNVTVFSKANLPSVKDLAKALQKSAQTHSASTNAIIKMDKTGHWVFGVESTEIEDDSLWALNPFSFVHGFIAWGDGEVLGEVMTPLHEPLPVPHECPPKAKRGWEKQLGLEITCISGADKGTVCKFATTSVGGLRAVSALGILLSEQIEKDQENPVAVLTLGSEYYIHKSYGKVYTPVFDVARWDSMDVNSASEEQKAIDFEEEEEEEEEEQKPAVAVRRRRSN